MVCLSRFNSMVLMLENANQMVRFAQRGQYHEVNLLTQSVSPSTYKEDSIISSIFDFFQPHYTAAGLHRQEIK